MQLEQTRTAYDIFIEVYAEKHGLTIQEAQQQVSPQDVETRLRALHQQWLNGAFSFGKFAELMDTPHWELWEMLDAARLTRSRTPSH